MYSWKTVLVTIAVLFGLKIWNPFLVENMKWSWFDFLHQQHEIEEVQDIVLVDIDEKSLEKYGQYPWPRDVYRDIMLESSYTNTHVFTQLFKEPDRFDGDAKFAEGLVNRLSILSAAPTIQKDTGSAPYVRTSVFGGGEIKDHIWNFSGIASPIEILKQNAYGVGVTVATPSISGTPNFDGTIRSAPLIVSANDVVYPSVALEVLRAFGDHKNYQVRVTEEVGIEWIRMGRSAPIETTSTADIQIAYWYDFKRISAAELSESDLQNKILVWGLTAEGLNNPSSTPVGVMYPHQVQASTLQSVLQEVRIQQSYYLEFLSYALLLTVLLGMLAMVYTLPTTLAGIVGLGIVGFQVGGSLYWWSSSLVLFDTFYSSIASIVVFGHASFNKYYRTFQLKEQIRKQFQKYLSPDMVDELAKNPEKLRLGGERKEMTFLFMDICGFTPISEAYKNNDDPEGLVDLINKFLDVQTKIIINNGGTIDKYMGDCIMAFWNAPLDCKEHADLAVKSAEEVLIATKELNEELSPLNLPPINVGIGSAQENVLSETWGQKLDLTIPSLETQSTWV